MSGEERERRGMGEGRGRNDREGAIGRKSGRRLKVGV